MIHTTRFAPSPTGYLHLGHARAAFNAARAGRRFLLRIEDIDRTRCRPLYTQALLEDLAWLGLHWENPVRQQSQHLGDYQAALERLTALGLTYVCTCTRADMASSASAPHFGPAGLVYPGTCRQRGLRPGMAPFAVRLNMAEAVQRLGPLPWHDLHVGEQTADPLPFGDVVLARKDTPTSYHLAVVVDDALQGVTLVTRGDDLFTATHVHRVLQALLGLPTPLYAHHPLLTNRDGERLSKRQGAIALRDLRAQGITPARIEALALGLESV